MATSVEKIIKDATTSTKKVNLIAPEVATKEGVVANINTVEKISKTSGKSYTQHILTLMDNSVHFFNYSISVNPGDCVKLFGEYTIAEKTGYSSTGKGGDIDTAHTTTGFSAKSVIIDIVATKAAVVYAAKKAEQSANLDAKMEFATKMEGKTSILDTWKALGF